MKVSIVYDGECPVCRRLVSATRLRQRGAELELVDARDQPVPAVQGQDLARLDFDQGFAVIVDGHLCHGAKAAQVLATLTERTGLGFRLFQLLNRTPGRSRITYPVLRIARKLLLHLMGIPRIHKH